MARFIELTPVETGVAQLLNAERFIEVRPTSEGGSELVTWECKGLFGTKTLSISVKESYNLVKRLLSNKSLDL